MDAAAMKARNFLGIMSIRLVGYCPCNSGEVSFNMAAVRD